MAKKGLDVPKADPPARGTSMPAGPAARCRALVASLALVIALGAPAARAQGPAPESRWDISLGGLLGAPSGWVQVRENQIEGTRLDLRHGLGIDRIWVEDVGVRYRLNRRDALRLTIDAYALDGTAFLPGDVRFNGATLAGGTALETRTRFPSFFRVTLMGERDLRSGPRGRITAAAGVTFVALTFRLHGTLAPTTGSHETKEDFVTQELPIPMVGLTLVRHLPRRLDAEASVAAGGLPRVNSLRHEGGVVRLRQHHIDVALGLAYRLPPKFRADAGYRYSTFTQSERSGEDDNEIKLSLNGLRLGLSRGY